MGGYFQSLVGQTDLIIGKARFRVTRAQLLALVGAPVDIIPAPGPGKFINLINAGLQYNPGTVDYTVNAPLTDFFVLGNSPAPFTALASEIVGGATFPLTRCGVFSSPTGLYFAATASPPYTRSDYIATSVAFYENMPLQLFFAAAVDLLAGDGTLDVLAYYVIEYI